MFSSCSALTALDVSSFNTASVTDDMTSIFSDCGNLIRIALGEKSLFTENPPQSGWTRNQMLDGAAAAGPTIANISDYTGGAPGWYEADSCAAGHKWDNGTVTREATYDKEGVKTFTCTVCGETKTESIAKLKVTVGSTITVGSAKYKVTAENTVQYKVPTSQTATLKIPASVTIGGNKYSVTSIAANAFKSDKKLTTLTIGSNVKTIGKNAFYNCTALKTVTLGSKVATISNQAFYKCTALKKVVIPDTVKTIGVKAFFGCTALTTVTLGSKVTTISDQAFSGCKVLTTLTIPAAVKTIGKQAFYNCKKLKTIVIKTTKLTSGTVGAKAFTGIYSKAVIKVPKAKLSAYKTLLKNKGIS